jgi:hypothetical protein
MVDCERSRCSTRTGQVFARSRLDAVTPNRTIDRTRSGGLRLPSRAGHRERWASRQ